jgi:hypothetical protein
MAILEKSTNNYYKIDFDNCMIKGLSVIVAYAVYLSDQDRLNEKERRPLITAFINAVNQEAGTKYEQLISKVNELGISAETDVDENGIIKEEVNAELRALQIEISDLSSMPNQIFEQCYRYGDAVPPEVNYFIDKQVLVEKYGLDETWITDPIKLTAVAQVYCDEYNGGAITQEFYYNRLKTRMSDNIQDC